MFELHHFADASMPAYGPASYIRIRDQEGRTYCSLMCSRSRVAPLKPIAIPRLELIAVALSVQQDEVLRRELTIKIDDSTFWTDSTIVLAYINNRSQEVPHVRSQQTAYYPCLDHPPSSGNTSDWSKAQPIICPEEPAYMI